MGVIALILMCAAIACFIVSAVSATAVNPPNIWWGRFLAIGLACWAGAEVLLRATGGMR